MSALNHIRQFFGLRIHTKAVRDDAGRVIIDPHVYGVVHVR